MLPLFVLACKSTGDADDEQDVKYSQQTPNGVERPDDEPEEQFEENLSTGNAIDLSFAQEVYCFPATENDNFSGNHVFFEVTQPIGTAVTVLATPEKKVDISLYVIQTTVDSTDLPPTITGGGGTTCEASYDQVEDDNPGQPEGLTIAGWESAYRLIIGVAGAHERSEGAFKIELWEE